MPPVFTLLASACPAPILSAGLLDPTTGTPVVAERVQPGTTTAGLAAINHNAVRIDLGGQHGAANVFSVKTGLDLTAGSGLTLNVAAGVGNVDGHIYHAAGTLALTDGTRNYIWLTRAGALSATTTTTPPTANQSLFLGSALCAAGAITAVDYSGRLEGLGGVLWRRTADTGVPADTPSSSARFLTRTAGGVYLWDGLAYWALAGVSQGRLAKVLPDANYTLTAAEALNRHLSFTGTLTAGRNVVLPLVDGAEYVAVNGTTGGFAITLIGATGTGVAVAAGKTAIVRSSGVDILRVTADI